MNKEDIEVYKEKINSIKKFINNKKNIINCTSFDLVRIINSIIGGK